MPDKVLMAFTQEQAARLSGLSQRQLAYWDTRGFFRPSLGSDNRREAYSRIYTFKDVAGLRTLGILINEHRIKTRYLREVKEKLRRPQEVWADSTIYVLGSKVYLQEPNQKHYAEATSGQYVLHHIPLRRVVKELERDVDSLTSRTEKQKEVVSQNRNIARNSQVISGTRVPIATVRDYIDAGRSKREILKQFPSLTEGDLDSVLRYLGRGAA